MSKNRLSQLYIKRFNHQLTKDEIDEMNKLRFEHSRYYNWLEQTYRNTDLTKEIKKVNIQEGVVYSTKKRSTQIKIMSTVAASIIVFIVVGIGYQISKINSSKQPTVAKISTIRHQAILETRNHIYQLNNRILIKDEDNEIQIDSCNRIEYKKISKELEYHTIKTPYGSQYNVVLSDGSVIHLNSNSRVSYPVCFNDSIRKIYASGEVFCEVKKCDRPFVVELNNQQIKVLGTSFNVRSYVDEDFTEITLVTGKVAVNAEGNEYLLAPDEQLLLNDHVEIKKVNAASYGSWRDDIIQYYDVSLFRLTESLSQLYNVVFVFDDDRLKNRIVVSGMQKSQPLNTNLQLIEKTCNVRFVEKNGAYIVKLN